jgi:hypothetical protein
MSDYKRSLGWRLEYIDHFNTRSVNTVNYSAISDLHTLQINATHAKTFQFAVSSPVVPSLTVSNSGDFSASAHTSLLFGEYPTTLPTAPTTSSLHRFPYKSELLLQLSSL